MASGIGLVVKIAADTKKAVGDIKDVNTALDGTGTSTGTASKMFSGLKSAALPVIGAVVAGVGAAAVAMVEFGKAALEDQQEAKKLARVLETIPGITQDMVTANEDWITSTMYATHVMDTDLREAVGELALITGDLALAQDYAARSADLATVANVDYSTATDAVEAALSGKTRALMGLAPWLDTNKDGTLDLAEAQAILTTETLDGQAAAAAAEDPWTTIMIIWGEIQEALGGALLPILEKVSDWFKNPENQKKVQDMIDKLARMATELGEKLVPKLEDFFEWLQSPEGKKAMRDFATAAGNIADAVGKIVTALGHLKSAWDKLPGFLKESGVVQFLTNPNSPLNRSAAPAPATAGGFSTTAPAGISINFYGGIHTDPEATARAISHSLSSSDWRNGRDRGRQLEPAW